MHEEKKQPQETVSFEAETKNKKSEKLNAFVKLTIVYALNDMLIQ